MPLTGFIRGRVPWKQLGVLMGTSWLLLAPGCSRRDHSGPEKSQSAVAAQETPMTATSAFAASLPRVGGPAGYVGSQDCRACHEDQYASWHRSYHRTMTQIAAPDTVQADFHNVTLTNEGVRFVLSQRSNELWVRMERSVPPAAGEPSREALDVRTGLVTGSHHMQVFWLPGDDGNTQMGFPFTWLIPEKRWVPRNSTFVRPPDVAHRAEIWNIICSRCHATAVEPRVDSVTHTVDTRVGELGIACEACHGPGQIHVKARRAARDNSKTPDAQTLRSEIVHPKKIDPIRASQICGFCHSMKWWDRSEDWRFGGFRYRPGDDLGATTPLIRPSKVQEIPGLAAHLARNPELLSDFFWPDGMVRVSGRDYNGLLESPCYRGGKFSCLSCHSLHESQPEDQLARNREGNGACTQCHERFRDEASVSAHTRHLAGSSGSECYNCHMPFTTYGVLKAIRSHQVSSPRIADELATGRPNACNLCHLDKPIGWAADRLAEWYRQPIPKLPENSSEIAHALRLALTGDAGQRVLVAWHLSWPSALQISGTNWIAPLLGQLLDDPYAAVRCVAARSLQAISGATPAGYDFVQEPRSRPPAREEVWRSWQQQWQAAGVSTPPSRGLLVWPSDLNAQRKAFDELLRLRDHRPVRLRE